MQSIYKINSLRNYQSSTYLDLIRGLAAIAVFIGHFRNLFFVDREKIVTKNIIIEFFYFITGFGHQAVIVFFVLSGFFVSSSIFKAHLLNQWSWKVYLINRLVRLEVVLIPALVLTYFWDSLGIHVFGVDGIYGGNGLGSNVSNYNILDKLNPSILLGNIFFLQNIFTPTFGSNGALWSLANEWWYYIALPLLISLSDFRSKWNSIFLLIYAFLLLLLTYFLVQSGIIYGFPIWLMGTIVCLMPILPIFNQNKSLGLLITILSLIVLIVSLLVVRFQLIKNDFIPDYLIGFCASLLLYFLLNNSGAVRQGFLLKISSFLASISYTLYLTHLPILLFAKAYLLTNARWQPDLSHGILSVLILALVSLYSFIIYYLTEAKTDKVRYFLLNHLGK
jgi:peptidoglycan/LPS O-acetylase OafA/YrhL